MWIKTSEQLPEPGQFVLAYAVNNSKNTRRIRAFYVLKFSVIPGGDDDAFEYNEADDNYYLPEGWYEANEYEETNWHVEGEVTHWMPLPEPPDSGGQKGW